MSAKVGWGELSGNGLPLGPVRYRIVHPQGSIWGDSTILARAAQSQQVLLAVSDGPPVRVRLRLGARGMASIQVL